MAPRRRYSGALACGYRGCEREGATTSTLALAATHRPRDFQPASVVVACTSCGMADPRAAGRVSPARTRTAAEPTMCSIAAAGSTDNDGNGLCLHRACASCGMADPRAHTQHAPVGPATEAAALPCVACCVMRCCGSCSKKANRTVQPDAMQWLWLRCRPVGYRQHGLGRQLSQLQAPSPRL